MVHKKKDGGCVLSPLTKRKKMCSESVEIHLWISSVAMSGRKGFLSLYPCLCMLCSWRASGGRGLMMICSAKLERCDGPMVTRHPSRTPVSHLPLVPEPNRVHL